MDNDHFEARGLRREIVLIQIEDGFSLFRNDNGNETMSIDYQPVARKITATLLAAQSLGSAGFIAAATDQIGRLIEGRSVIDLFFSEDTVEKLLTVCMG